MTPDRLKKITSELIDRNTLTRLLGYRSNNTIRQWESGKGLIPNDIGEWIEEYAAFRVKQMAESTDWITKNPPPTRDND